MLLGPPPPRDLAGRGRNSAARPTSASGSGLGAPGSGRAAERSCGVVRSHGRRLPGGRRCSRRVPAAGLLRAERAGPGRRAPKSHPRRGPRAQRRAQAGTARGPRPMSPPPPPDAPSPGGQPLSRPRRAGRAEPSVSARLASVRGAQLAHCAPAGLAGRGRRCFSSRTWSRRKKSKQDRAVKPPHARPPRPGGRCDAIRYDATGRRGTFSPNRPIQQCHPNRGAAGCPALPRGARPPHSPLLPMREEARAAKQYDKKKRNLNTAEPIKDGTLQRDTTKSDSWRLEILRGCEGLGHSKF
ncbi:uncharacterized protein LOC126020201 [Suncus etruscus]|uniref:uncharacterized protein LOC126020201 n=1 Tax=Suncus etruscus TaxID=109475 RepID=UPI00210FE64B|nr:uncharacterized protein LOC126020201 [Suncus etruscus]